MPDTVELHQTDIREYLRVFRTRRYEILIATVLVVAATGFLTLRQTPVYEGQVKVLVNPVQNPSSSFVVPQQPNLDTERQLITSQAVAQKVQSELHLTATVDVLLRHVSVEVLTNTEVLVVKYDDVSPIVAARIANGFAKAYVEFRTEQAVQQYEAAAAAVTKRINGIQASLADLEGRIKATTDPTQIDSLQAQRDTLVAQMGVLQSRLLDLQSNASVVQGTAAQIVQPAEIPRSPVSPNKVRNGALALVGGLALGVGFAFLRERLDDRIKGREEMERRLGAPVLAVVPKVAAWRRQEQAYLVLREDPKSPVSEAYRTLATNIQYLGSREGLKALMVTSGLAGDGKTTTSANLAVALAQAGKRVVLISADLRKQRLHRFFSLSNVKGMSDALSGRISLAEATRDPGVPNLRLIVGGATPANPAALLGSQAAKEMIESLREVADFIIIDTPPVLAVADASILAPHTDGALLVIEAGQSSRSALMQTRDQLETAGGQIIGAVFNNFDPNQGKAYAYHYYYYNYYAEYHATENGTSGRNGRRPRARRGSSLIPGRNRRAGRS